jgi:hypothetical protein
MFECLDSNDNFVNVRQNGACVCALYVCPLLDVCAGAWVGHTRARTRKHIPTTHTVRAFRTSLSTNIHIAQIGADTSK